MSKIRVKNRIRSEINTRERGLNRTIKTIKRSGVTSLDEVLANEIEFLKQKGVTPPDEMAEALKKLEDIDWEQLLDTLDNVANNLQEVEQKLR